MAQVQVGDTVRIRYEGKRQNGEIFARSPEDQSVQFKTGEGRVISGIEQAVIGMEEGETRSVVIPPENAYGNPRDELVITMERSSLPEELEIEIGQDLKFKSTGGEEVVAKITQVTDREITVDANHPLSGEEVTFDIEVVEIV